MGGNGCPVNLAGEPRKFTAPRVLSRGSLYPCKILQQSGYPLEMMHDPPPHRVLESSNGESSGTPFKTQPPLANINGEMQNVFCCTDYGSLNVPDAEYLANH